MINRTQAAEIQGRLPWNLNDVSYLFEIPKGTEGNTDHLFKPTDFGSHGLLLPSAVYDLLPTLLIAGNGNATLYKQALRVVSLRVDPCPATIDPGAPCQGEIRLVWQPIEKDPFKGKWLSRDGAVHSFYRIEPRDWKNLITNLWELKVSNLSNGVDTTRRTLGIHPAFFAGEKAKDHFIQEVRRIVLHFCGEDNLYKTTYMSVLTPGQWWRFGGFRKKADGTWVQFRIPRLEDSIEDIFNVAPHDSDSEFGEKMDAVFNVLPESYPEIDDLLPVINKGFRYDDERDFSIFKDKLNTVARFLNPAVTNPETLDCASCHFAGATRFYAFQRFPQLAVFRAAEEFQNPEPDQFDLTNTTVAKSSTRVMRAFGYFNDQPVVHQRVINDSAQSAHALNLQAPYFSETPHPSR